MAGPLILYSVNSWLAYTISEQFYDHVHYVWCTPYYDSTAVAAVDSTTPPTSTPCDIYSSLDSDTRRGDRHSAKISENKVGILRGATYKRQAGIVTEAQERDIASIVAQAETIDFRPLLYLIPLEGVKSKVKEVPIDQRAHPLSIEYVIDELPRDRFDAIELRRRS